MRHRPRLWLGFGIGAVLAVVLAAFAIWRDDILQTLLDPQIP
jgi:ABC-type nitrate/sulfonate/bicarbonate transport system permease component